MFSLTRITNLTVRKSNTLYLLNTRQVVWYRGWRLWNLHAKSLLSKWPQRLAEDYKLRQAQSYVWGQAKQEYTHTCAVCVQIVNFTVCTQLKATLWLEYACDHTTSVETLLVNNIIEERSSSY